MGLHHHKIKTTLTLALALGALAPDAAWARLDLNPTPARTTPSQPAVQIVRVSAPEAFDWGDAGIGAAASLGLSMLVIGGGAVIAARRRSTPRMSSPAAPHKSPLGPTGDLSREPVTKSIEPALDHQEAVT
jgi:hypothetical protein